MKEFINIAHVTGIANGRIIEAEDSACVVNIEDCPPNLGICLCKNICKRIPLNCNCVKNIDGFRFDVRSKSIRSSQTGKTLFIEYTLCVLYIDHCNRLQEACLEDSITFLNIEGNVSIDNISVSITNPPTIIESCNSLQIFAKITVEY